MIPQKGSTEEAHLAAIRDDLASVSTTACSLLIAVGRRNPMAGRDKGVSVANDGSRSRSPRL